MGPCARQPLPSRFARPGWITGTSAARHAERAAAVRGGEIIEAAVAGQGARIAMVCVASSGAGLADALRGPNRRISGRAAAPLQTAFGRKCSTARSPMRRGATATRRTGGRRGPTNPRSKLPRPGRGQSCADGQTNHDLGQLGACGVALDTPDCGRHIWGRSIPSRANWRASLIDVRSSRSASAAGR